MRFKHAPAYSYSFILILIHLFLSLFIHSYSFHSQFFTVSFYLSSTSCMHAWTINFIFPFIFILLYPKRSQVSCSCGSHGRVRDCQPEGHWFDSSSYRIYYTVISFYSGESLLTNQRLATHKHTNTHLANNVAYTKNLLQGSCVF